MMVLILFIDFSNTPLHTDASPNIPENSSFPTFLFNLDPLYKSILHCDASMHPYMQMKQKQGTHRTIS